MEHFQKNVFIPQEKRDLKKFQTWKKHFTLKSAVKNLTVDFSLNCFRKA